MMCAQSIELASIRFILDNYHQIEKVLKELIEIEEKEKEQKENEEEEKEEKEKEMIIYTGLRNEITLDYEFKLEIRKVKKSDYEEFF